MIKIKTEKLNSFSRFCAGAICVIALLFMAVLLISSLLGTTGMSTGGVGKTGEIVSFVQDNIFLNIIALLLGMAIIYFILRLTEHRNIKIIAAVTVGITAVFALAFVLSGKMQPSEDSYIVTYTARLMSENSSLVYVEYFAFFPYQFGFVLYEEIFFRLFNLIMPNAPEGFSSLILQGLNVVYVAVFCLALLACMRYIIKDESARKLAAVLLMCFLPLPLFATYMYGTIPGFTFAALAVLMFLRFQDRGRIVDALGCAVFMSIAVCLKLNCLIVLMAIAIIWVIEIIKNPKLRSFIMLALTVAVVLVTMGLPQKYYEARNGIDFGKGIPRLSWMAMGLNEGQSCSGWYDTTYTTDVFRDSGYNYDETAEAAREAIKERAEYFKSSPKEAVQFFARKLLSQWNEPTYQSLWTNQSRKSYSESGGFFNFICNTASDNLTILMNFYQQLIFFGFTLGLIALFRKKDIRAVIFPLIILGGLLYHLLFEAKSQYALCYVVMMIPVAAYGFVRFMNAIAERSARRGSK